MRVTHHGSRIETAPLAVAQTLDLTNDATLSIRGGIQPRADIGAEGADDTERVGLGLRRARLQFRLTVLGDVERG